MWTTPDLCLPLKPTDVHLWLIDLTAKDSVLRRSLDVLSAKEREQANRFHFEWDRQRFTIARGTVKQILSRYADVSPHDLELSYSPSGRPILPKEQDQFGTDFNLSHSENLAILAIAQGARVGIDVEFINSDIAIQEIAEHCLCPKEIDALLAFADKDRVLAFFTCWTRKEAFVKALGEGLSVELTSFEVGCNPMEASKPLFSGDKARLAGGAREETRWSVYDLPVGPKYKAALVAEGTHHSLHYWEFADALNIWRLTPRSMVTVLTIEGLAETRRDE